MNYTYIAGIKKALEYIESHLQDELNVSEIAKQANCSPFYFQRIFGLLCGMPLGEYVRNRKLAVAGSELQKTKGKVIDIALKFGYDSPESFTRAFTKFHGVTPSQAKKKNTVLRSFSALSVKLLLKGGNFMNYKIVEKEAFYVLEKVSKHTVANDENNKTIPEFWARCREDGTVQRLLEKTTDGTFLFGICYAQKENTDTFNYSVAALCDKDTAVPDGFEKTLIPTRTWAVFECVGAMPTAIQDLWREIVSEFFPASGYVPTQEFDIEAYADGDMSAANYHSQIWVPVQKK